LHTEIRIEKAAVGCHRNTDRGGGCQSAAILKSGTPESRGRTVEQAGVLICGHQETDGALAQLSQSVQRVANKSLKSLQSAVAEDTPALVHFVPAFFWKIPPLR
jgi:hypothetical protein